MSVVAPGLITVFGGSGFVGSQVVRNLARRGWRIRVAVRRPDRAWKLQTSGHGRQVQAVRCGATNAGHGVAGGGGQGGGDDAENDELAHGDFPENRRLSRFNVKLGHKVAWPIHPSIC